MDSEVAHKLSSVHEMQTVKSDSHQDEEFKGIRVNCNGIDCIFEFQVFRYKGANAPREPSTLQTHNEQLPDLSTINNTLPTQAGLTHSTSVPLPTLPLLDSKHLTHD